MQFQIVDDTIDEEVEIFEARLTLASTDVSAVQIQPDLAMLFIQDNDGKKNNIFIKSEYSNLGIC